MHTFTSLTNWTKLNKYLSSQALYIVPSIRDSKKNHHIQVKEKNQVMRKSLEEIKA